MSKTILSKKAKPSQRQYELMIMRAMRMKYTEIEQKLSISQKVLKRHLEKLMFQLGCFSQQDLIDFAKSQGWIKAISRDQGIAYEIKPYEKVETVRIYKSSNL